MIVLEKLQEIYTMGISEPLADYKTKNYYETPNCHQKLEMIALKKTERDELNGP